MTSSDRALRRAECARRAGVHVSTWFRWERLNLVPRARVLGPRCRGIYESEFLAWLASRQHVGAVK